MVKGGTAAIEMNERERKLFDATEKYVRRACPKLDEAKRIMVVAAVYDKMHFVTKMPEKV